MQHCLQDSLLWQAALYLAAVVVAHETEPLFYILLRGGAAVCDTSVGSIAYVCLVGAREALLGWLAVERDVEPLVAQWNEIVGAQGVVGEA